MNKEPCKKIQCKINTKSLPEEMVVAFLQQQCPPEVESVHERCLSP
jgi:hypothetical protein